MTTAELIQYVAHMYGKKATDKSIEMAVKMGVEYFLGEKPWSFIRGIITLTTDSDGIIEFPEDYDGVHTLREQSSSAGGWIQPWSESKFDGTVPRLDNLTGSYPVVCKVYEQDGTTYGQMAPPVGSMDIYVSYKRKGQATDIPDKFSYGVLDAVHAALALPGTGAYRETRKERGDAIKKIWKADRQTWSTIWRSMDDEDVRAHMKWWGVWAW